MFPQEINLWKRKWTENVAKDLPNSAIEAYVKCNYEYFPNISFLLNILSTLPASTATPERSFSTLKRLKKLFKKFLRSRTIYRSISSGCA